LDIIIITIKKVLKAAGDCSGRL